MLLCAILTLLSYVDVRKERFQARDQRKICELFHGPTARVVAVFAALGLWAVSQVRVGTYKQHAGVAAHVVLLGLESRELLGDAACLLPRHVAVVRKGMRKLSERLLGEMIRDFEGKRPESGHSKGGKVVWIGASLLYLFDKLVPCLPVELVVGVAIRYILLAFH
jgi:hypothetical protein